MTTDNAAQAPPGAMRARLALRRCPACGSADVRRSTIRSRDAGAHALRSPYRCRACRERFWVLSRKARTFTVVGVGAALVFAAFMFVTPPYDDSAMVPIAPASEEVEILTATPLRDRLPKAPSAQTASSKAGTSVFPSATATLDPPATPRPAVMAEPAPAPVVIEKPLGPPAQPFVK